jgi:hypothetical protein
MRYRIATLLAVGVVLSTLGRAEVDAQTFSSGSTGADGAFSPTVNTTVTLPASGVLNYTTVNIPIGVTVKFTKNAANTPVTILATGNVTIAGTIDIRGNAGAPPANGTAVGTTGGAGGPGGFDGGNGATGTVSTTGGSGRGPGGGTGSSGAAGAGGGGFAAAGGNGTAPSGATAGIGGSVYSDATLLPLIGGSGGGGGGANLGYTGGGGGGGGGAILIASSGTISLSGSILASGGPGTFYDILKGSSGGGSGGAVRLIATTVTGSSGTINVAGGAAANPGSPSNIGGGGGAGRARIEGFTNTLSATFTGAVSASVSSGAPTSVTLSNAPTLQITSIAGVAAPASPSASFFAPDVVLPGTTTNPVTVNISASNVPVGTTLTVTVVGLMGASSSVTSTALSGSLAASTATASVTLPTNEPAIVSASATYAIAAIDGQGTYYADGEPVEGVRIATRGAGGSALAFITRSGREVTVSAR